MKLEDLQGLISNECGERLAQLAATVSPEHAIVEIGSFKGKSSCYLASLAQGDVYSIDPWDSPRNIYGKHGYSDPVVFETFKTQVASLGLQNKITPIKAFSYNAVKTWNKPIGLLFIDGSHTYDDVKRDFLEWIGKVVPGGIIVFDDYVGRNKGVTSFVNQLKVDSVLVDWDFTSPPMAIARCRPLNPKVKLSTAIMAHQKRERFIPYLLNKMGSNTPVVWDRINNRWDTGQRSMLAYDKTATHHIVVQDDAILCNDFLLGVENALRFAPEGNPVSLYTGRVRPNYQIVQRAVREATKLHYSWIRMDGPWWGVAVVIPTHLIEEMINWCNTSARSIANYDSRMTKFFLTKKLKCYYTIPSLVTHRVGPDNPSLVPGRGSGTTRIAFEFIGEENSALNVDWTVGYVNA